MNNFTIHKPRAFTCYLPAIDPYCTYVCTYREGNGITFVKLTNLSVTNLFDIYIITIYIHMCILAGFHKGNQ